MREADLRNAIMRLAVRKRVFGRDDVLPLCGSRAYAERVLDALEHEGRLVRAGGGGFALQRDD